MANNEINEHSICGDAAVLVPSQFKKEFGKTRNVKAPLLLIDAKIFGNTLDQMTDAMREANWQYAMKTNDDPGLIATAVVKGAALDFSSVGEAEHALKVIEALEIDSKPYMARCSYGNPNKTTSDIRRAYDLGIRKFSVDDTQEIDKIAAVAPGSSVYLRTFIDATQGTAISVFTNKFGAPEAELVKLALHAKNKGLKPYSVGLSVGGGQTDPGAFALAVEKAASINTACHEAGVPSMTGVTFCGGLPAQSAPGAPTFKTIGASILDACNEYGIAPKDVTFEPGRSLGTTCGIIRAKVISMKKPYLNDSKWTLVLDIGVFKGLFEMERTNLTYKIATYDTAAANGKDGSIFDEMVPCRIVDDTCDSKGVCFKEKTVMMPSSLVEGSSVYFINTGSYTTAYVMEGFNRTLGLVSKCFNSPLSSIVDLPAWLTKVQTPGEAAYPGKDFTALWTKLRGMPDDDSKDRCLIEEVPGAATFGFQLLDAEWIKLARDLNNAILLSSPDKPGSQHKAGFQPQQNFHQSSDSWIMNSALESPNSWKYFDQRVPKAGATAYLCLQHQYRSSVRHCTLMHATLVIVPDDQAADGPPTFVEVNYNPYTIDGLDEAVLERAFGSALREEKVYRDPTELFEQLMAGKKLDPKFANPDLVWAGSLKDREPLAIYWPDATMKAGQQKRGINLEGALVYKLNPVQHGRIKRPISFADSSYSQGYGVSTRSHVDRNSCILTTIRLLADAIIGKDYNFGSDWPTDRVIAHMSSLASERLWAENSKYTVRDIASFKKAAKSINKDEFCANFQSILCHPTMMRPHGGENSFNTTYMSNPPVPHPDYHAQQVLHFAAQRALKHLEQKAFSIGAVEGTVIPW